MHDRQVEFCKNISADISNSLGDNMYHAQTLKYIQDHLEELQIALTALRSGQMAHDDFPYGLISHNDRYIRELNHIEMYLRSMGILLDDTKDFIDGTVDAAND